MPITVIIGQYPVLVTKRGQHVYQLSLDSEPNVWQCSELLRFFFPPISVIGCVRDRLDNMQTAGNGLCANCKWKWKTPLTTRKENENTGFLIWIKDKGTYLCYLCAQSCPSLADHRRAGPPLAHHKLCKRLQICHRKIPENSSSGRMKSVTISERRGWIHHNIGHKRLPGTTITERLGKIHGQQMHQLN